MVAFYKSSRRTSTVGATKKHIYPFQKYGQAKAQPPSRATMSSRQQQQLLEVASLANNLLAKMRGQAK
jgi:hypothetical protein